MRTSILIGSPVLSVRQPWAWMIVHGIKNIENRTWVTKHRGPLLIHASSAMSRADYEEAVAMCGRTWKIPAPTELVKGAVIGSVNVVDCVPFRRRKSAGLEDNKWFTGPFGFVLSEAEAFAPEDIIRRPGKLGIWRL